MSDYKAEIDELLDQLGFQHKPGSTKGRMYSSRFYHAELKQAIAALIHSETTKARLDELHRVFGRHNLKDYNPDHVYPKRIAELQAEGAKQ